jgi:Bcr/CflA subfamily drug resistance transporter
MNNSMFKIVFVAVTLTSLGQIVADMYVPFFVAIAHSLGTSVDLVQATVSLYMLSMALSRLLCGPISDALGRRRPLIFGTFICFLGSVICMISNNVHIFSLGRLLQGLGAGVGSVVSGTIVRDSLQGQKMNRAFSYISMINVLAISTAPFIGGYMGSYLGWRANFAFMAFFSMLVWYVVVFILPETNVFADVGYLRFRQIRENILRVLSNRFFLGYAGCVVSVFSAIFVWLTLGSVLLQETYGLSQMQYSWGILICGSGYAVGAFCNSWLVNYYKANRIIMFGCIISLLGGVFGFLPCFQVYCENSWHIFASSLIFLFGVSLVLSNAFAGALIPFRKIAGMAGSILGCLQGLGAAIASAVVAMLPDDSAIPLSLSYIGSSVIALGFILYIIRISRK